MADQKTTFATNLNVEGRLAALEAAVESLLNAHAKTAETATPKE